MNKEKTRNAIEVMQAYVDGKEIEVLVNGHHWKFTIGDTESPAWNWKKYDYRINKEEPKRVPLSPEDIKPGDCIKRKGDCDSTWDMIVSVGGFHVWHAFGSETVKTSYTDLMEKAMIRSIGESEWRDCWKVEE